MAHFAKIEGQNLQMLKKGTSSAEKLTVQFWVKSTITGTYVLEVRDTDNTRVICKTYTVSSSNTWEKKTLTFDADTTGTLTNDNNESVALQWWLLAGSTYSGGTLQTTWAALVDANRAVGQVNACNSTSNEIYFTGIQIEVGEVATAFEHRSFGDEIARCQRYYYRTTVLSNDSTIAAGFNQNANAVRAVVHFPVTMRTAPTALEQSGTASDVSIYHGTSLTVCTGVPSFNSATQHCAEFQANTSGLTAGQGCTVSLETTGYLAWSAEL